MRRERDAPVDVLGCSSLGDRCATIPDWRFHVLVGCFLSSQTKDEATAACMDRLKERGLVPENIIKLTQDELSAVLRGVSFHNTKAKNLKIISELFVDAKLKAQTPPLSSLPHSPDYDGSSPITSLASVPAPIGKFVSDPPSERVERDETSKIKLPMGMVDVRLRVPGDYVPDRTKNGEFDTLSWVGQG
eukprot:GHVN01058011.1.p1 GENE.GHVN01058011.1~~GHVN01058011.1.p1  ORF type:complete len:189 (+),score=45.44 GHVN01058011.1:311-877(+)